MGRVCGSPAVCSQGAGRRAGEREIHRENNFIRIASQLRYDFIIKKLIFIFNFMDAEK
jgi:hypothetical protein